MPDSKPAIPPQPEGVSWIDGLAEFLMGDGLHFTVAGQKRLALEVLTGWSHLA